jgi:hypothetical protein
MRIDPKFSVELRVKSIPFRDQKAIDDYVAAMRKAGLK